MAASPLMTLEEIASVNPALANAKILIDRATQQASVIDVIRLITGKKSNAAGEAFQRLGRELVANCDQLRINGKGKPTPVCDAPTMVELIWELPGKAAKAFRRQCAHYIVRILGGDASLVEEMRDRADASTSSQRDFFLGKRGTDAREQDEAAAQRLKLRRDEAELTRLEAETQLYVKEQAAKGEQLTLQVEREKMDLEQRKAEMNASAVTFYRNLVQEVFHSDAHMQAAFKDYTMATLGRGSTQTTGATTLAQFAPDISTIASDLGFRGQSNAVLSRLGKAIAKAYRARHGRAPETTQKYVNGSVRRVNAYRQSDVAMIQEIIRTVLDPPAVQVEVGH
jgi:hypothetical protein